MDCVTSRFDLGESLDPVDEFRVENNICTFSARSASSLHESVRAAILSIFTESSRSLMMTVRVRFGSGIAARLESNRYWRVDPSEGYELTYYSLSLTPLSRVGEESAPARGDSGRC